MRPMGADVLRPSLAAGRRSIARLGKRVTHVREVRTAASKRLAAAPSVGGTVAVADGMTNRILRIGETFSQMRASIVLQ